VTLDATSLAVDLAVSAADLALLVADLPLLLADLALLPADLARDLPADPALLRVVLPRLRADGALRPLLLAAAVGPLPLRLDDFRLAVRPLVAAALLLADADDPFDAGLEGELPRADARLVDPRCLV
jgi:hypothetical protein